MKKRPLATLENKYLLCSGLLSSWRPSNSAKEQDICVESIDCRDWETGKKSLVFLDHCWLRMSSKGWEVFSKLGVRDGYKTSRLDPLWFLATPEYYRRSDGSEDWGLYILSTPTTKFQAEGVRSEFRRLSKPGARIVKPGREYQRILMTTHLLKQKREDWRLYSKRGPEAALEACAHARRNAEAGLRHVMSKEQLKEKEIQVKDLYNRIQNHL